MILAVAVLMGMASGHRVAKSMHVSKNLNPPVAVGKGPTRSIATFKWYRDKFPGLHLVVFRVTNVHSLAFIALSDMTKAIFSNGGPVKKRFD